MTNKSREKELARAAAKREEEKRKAKRRAGVLRVLAAVVAIVVAAGVIKVIVDQPRRRGASGNSPSPPLDFPCDTEPPKVTSVKLVAPEAPAMTIDPDKNYGVVMNTGCGQMQMKLFAKQSPITVNNFVTLAKKHWYNGLVFHRVSAPIEVIQAGDPKCSDGGPDCGTGGPGYTITDEYENGLPFKIGSVAMANSGQPDTSGSQFFIITGERGLSLPPEYTVFGQLVGQASLDVARRIQSVPVNGETPKAPVWIRGVKITETKGR